MMREQTLSPQGACEWGDRRGSNPRQLESQGKTFRPLEKRSHKRLLALAVGNNFPTFSQATNQAARVPQRFISLRKRAA